MFKRAATAFALASALVLTGSTAFAGSTSTKLSNGTLTFIANDGCTVSGNCSLFYASTSYKKTGGATVSIILSLATGKGYLYDSQQNISAGQTKTKSWGGLLKSSTDCTPQGYMKTSTGNYYTPYLKVC